MFAEPETVTENCWDCAGVNVADCGVTDAVTPDATVIVPPVAVTGMAVAVGEAAEAFDS